MTDQPQGRTLLEVERSGLKPVRDPAGPTVAVCSAARVGTEHATVHPKTGRDTWFHDSPAKAPQATPDDQRARLRYRYIARRPPMGGTSQRRSCTRRGSARLHRPTPAAGGSVCIAGKTAQLRNIQRSVTAASVGREVFKRGICCQPADFNEYVTGNTGTSRLG